MALVNYSESESSDNEQSAAQAPKTSASKSTFPQLINNSGTRKIKVDLPSEDKAGIPEQEDQPPPTKRSRTNGAFSGFNSLLPAPKRTAQDRPRPGVNLKTSSEAAFSRSSTSEFTTEEIQEVPGESSLDSSAANEPVATQEPKLVGKATKFRPLSVANKKRVPKKVKSVKDKDGAATEPELRAVVGERRVENVKSTAPSQQPPVKRSLFSLHSEQDEAPEALSPGNYETPTTIQDGEDTVDAEQVEPSRAPAASNPNSLQAAAADLNLTAAQRRQLFGRHGRDGDVNVTRFNTDHEYASNEQLRQAGEVIEHRAVKTIAPGKHSLQQLVNNARSQQDAMEDKWADGKRERGEAGSKYGWG